MGRPLVEKRIKLASRGQKPTSSQTPSSRQTSESQLSSVVLTEAPIPQHPLVTSSLLNVQRRTLQRPQWAAEVELTESMLFGKIFLKGDVNEELLKWDAAKLMQCFQAIARSELASFTTDEEASQRYDEMCLRNTRSVDSWGLFGPPYYGEYPIISEYCGPFKTLREHYCKFYAENPEAEPGAWWYQVAVEDANLFMFCESLILNFAMLMELSVLLRLVSDYKDGQPLPCKNSLSHLKFKDPLIVSKAYKVFRDVRAVLNAEGKMDSLSVYEKNKQATWRHLQYTFQPDASKQKVLFLAYDPDFQFSDEATARPLCCRQSSLWDCLDHYFVAITPRAGSAIVDSGLVDPVTGKVREEEDRVRSLKGGVEREQRSSLGRVPGTVYRALLDLKIADDAAAEVHSDRVGDMLQHVAADKRVRDSTTSTSSPQAYVGLFPPKAPDDPFKLFWEVEQESEANQSDETITNMDQDQEQDGDVSRSAAGSGQALSAASAYQLLRQGECQSETGEARALSVPCVKATSPSLPSGENTVTMGTSVESMDQTEKEKEKENQEEKEFVENSSYELDYEEEMPEREQEKETGEEPEKEMEAEEKREEEEPGTLSRTGISRGSNRKPVGSGKRGGKKK